MRRNILGKFEIQTEHLIPAERLELVMINEKERTCWIVDFAASADHIVKIKENKKRGKYLDLGKEVPFRNYEIWKWQWYQSWLGRLERSRKTW